MRKPARRHPESERHVLCPFCDTACDTVAATPLCSGCGAERSLRSSGEVIFDSARRADRQTVAEASRINEASEAGGLKGAARRRPRRLGKKRR